MGINLGGLLTAGGNALAAKNQAAAQGLAQQQQMRLQMLMLQRQQQELERQNALAQSTITKNAAQGALARARIPGLLNPQTPLAYQTDKDGNIIGLPTRVSAGQSPTPVQTGVKGQPKAPVMGSPDWLRAQSDLERVRAQFRPPPQQSFVFPTVMGPNGVPVIARGNTKTGQIEPTDINAKPTGGSGQSGSAPVSQRAMFMGEVARKAADVLPFLATGHIGLMGAAARDVAHEGILGMPGTKDLGNFAMNHIDPNLAAYNAGTAELTLNAGHALGGVRGGSESQMKQLGQSLELHSGDAPVARQQKIRNVADLLSSMFASLPPDLRQQQYASLGAQRVALLRQYGFDPEHAIPLQYQDTATPNGSNASAAPDLSDVHAYLKTLRGGKKP